jgi:hypothetical protein
MTADATGKKAEDEKAQEDDDAGTEHSNRFARLHCEYQAARGAPRRLGPRLARQSSCAPRRRASSLPTSYR